MNLYEFLSGAVALAFFVVALFFVRFWRRTDDGLFLAFAASFVLLATGQSVLALAAIRTEERGSLYLIRLAAFALIIVAIARKNLGATR